MVPIAQRLEFWFVEPAIRVRFPLGTPRGISIELPFNRGGFLTG